MPINQINENTIRLFILETIKELTLCKESCRKFFNYIKNVIRYARIEKIIIENPMEFLEPKDFKKHNRLKNEFSVGKTKTKKSRGYPIDEQITELLSRIKHVQTEYDILCEWIFTDGNGGYTHARNITDCMTRLCRENGLSGGGITKLRKTASSDLQASGTPKPTSFFYFIKMKKPP